jgi:transposase
MDTDTPDLKTLPVTGKRERRSYSPELKQKMIAETFGIASVSTVARRYDVNANQLFRWRKQYLDKNPGSPVVLPVEVVESEPVTTSSQLLEISLGATKQLRVPLDCPAELLRVAIEAIK